MTVTDHFPYPLILEASDDGWTAIVAAPYVFLDAGVFVGVHRGFETDFNSAPRLVWRIFAKWEYPSAGVIHDHLYRYPHGFTRKQCDDVHFRVLQLKGCPFWKRYAAYAALRLFGWGPWHKYREGLL